MQQNYFQGYYPTSETVEYTEDEPPKPETSFVAKLCCDWEDSASLPSDHPSRVVTVRIGLVLGREGGVVKSMIWPFWFGVGGMKHTLSQLSNKQVFQKYIESFSLDNSKCLYVLE